LKTIIYLDQNYLSNITKARLGTNFYPKVPSHYLDLYSALREAVGRDLMVCPVSSFHRTESELDTRLELEIYGTLSELYCGTELRNYPEILQEQTKTALYEFLGKRDTETKARWHEAFESNPHISSQSPAPRLRAPGATFATGTRAVKVYHEQEREPQAVGDLAKQKRFEACQLIFWLYLRSGCLFALGDNDLDTVFMLQYQARLSQEYSDLLGRKPTAFETAHFLASDQMRAAPFIDVYSSLRAGMVVWGAERRPKGSDLNDVFMAATILPYCDVFATDGYIKSLTQRSKLDTKYKLLVFGSHKADVLALTSYVRQLA